MASKLTLISLDESIGSTMVDDDDEEVTFSSAQNHRLEVNEMTSPGKSTLHRRAVKRRHNGTVSPKKVAEPEDKSAKIGDERKFNGKENVDLKEILLKQLEIIRKQSEEIVSKDIHLRELQKENEKLKAKLKSFQLNKEDAVKEEPKKTEKLNAKKKVIPETEEQKTVQKKRKFVKTQEPYFVRQGEEDVLAEQKEVQKILSDIELPAWRVNVVPKSHDGQGAENVDQEVFEKRHSKLEKYEQKRKRSVLVFKYYCAICIYMIYKSNQSNIYVMSSYSYSLSVDPKLYISGIPNVKNNCQGSQP